MNTKKKKNLVVISFSLINYLLLYVIQLLFITLLDTATIEIKKKKLSASF